MKKRNGFLTFLAALVPGVGYMYLGLVKKGIQIFILYILISPVFNILGINFLSSIVMIPIWFYAFLDTFRVANRLDRGEHIEDTDFIFKKYASDGEYPIIDRIKVDRNLSMIAAWVLIAVGVLAIMNRVLRANELYHIVRGFVGIYFFPVFLVFVGIYILFRHK